MLSRLAARIGAMALVAALAPAIAQAVVLQIDFEATGDTLANNPSTGTIVLDVEPGVDVENAPVISSSLNFGPITDVVFNVFNGRNVVIGGLGNASTTLAGTDDFRILIFGVFGTPNFSSFTEQTVVGGVETASSFTGSITTVPLPAPALLLLAGLCALTLAARRSA
ncbi:MAG: hypothetical protein AAFP17_05485 [Pseudomonadota bacterium]